MIASVNNEHIHIRSSVCRVVHGAHLAWEATTQHRRNDKRGQQSPRGSREPSLAYLSLHFMGFHSPGACALSPRSCLRTERMSQGEMINDSGTMTGGGGKPRGGRMRLGSGAPRPVDKRAAAAELEASEKQEHASAQVRLPTHHLSCHTSGTQCLACYSILQVPACRVSVHHHLSSSLLVQLQYDAQPWRVRQLER